MTTQHRNPNATFVTLCHGDQRYGGERVYDEPVLVSVLAGELRVVQAARTLVCVAGDTVLLPRHQPATLLKYPQNGFAYQALVVQLPRPLVRAYYAQHPPLATRTAASGLRHYPPHPLVQSLLASLRPYMELTQSPPESLLAAKVTEAIEVLRSLDPQADGVLADFSEPGKLNLVEFMQAHYLVNLPLARFSYLTGRSLTTFKRDFKKAFQLSPQRWLTQQRLAQAHYQLTEKGRRPAELYQEVGFENLAHFSFAFKKQFGYPPTALSQPPAGRAVRP
jgi:AraC-like DNA-binding protein